MATVSFADEPDRGSLSRNESVETGNQPLETLKKRSPRKRWEQLKQSIQFSRKSPFRTSVDKAGPSKQLPKNDSEFDSDARFIKPLIIDEPNENSVEQDTAKTKTFIDFFNGFKADQKEKPAIPLPPIAVAQLEKEAYSDPVRDPSELKKITNILPYFDYEPDTKVAGNNPCNNLCPRPDGLPCKPFAKGDRIPQCPQEVQLGGGVYEGRTFDDLMFMWEASDLYHNPLYFEDPSLERYGHTHHDLIQPFVSTAKFGTQLLGLPYQMTIDPVCKRMYPLGWYRPGECAPYLYRQIPWNTEAAIKQAGVVTGLIFAIP